MCGVASQPREWTHSQFCLRTEAMNKEWYQHILREQLLPTIQEQFGDEQCLFQHDGVPCHKPKVITKWLGEQNIDFFVSMARADCRGYEKEGSTLQILTLHQLHVIVNKSLWHLWNACNYLYTSVFHSNTWQKYLKTLRQQTLWKLIFVTLRVCVCTHSI